VSKVTDDFKKRLDGLFALVKEKVSRGNKVFVSTCCGQERARVFVGTGNSLDTAFKAAKDLAVKHQGEYINYIMIDVVTKETPMTVREFYKKLLFPTRRGYLRYGISFDEFYDIAFLEQEIYGAGLIKYIDKNNQYFYEENITSYLKKSRGFSSKYKFECDPSRDIIVFETRAVFDNGKEQYELESSVDSLNKGYRITTLEQDEEALLDSVRATADYLLSTQEKSGRTAYGYHACFDVPCPGYNILRHTLGMLALADIYLLTKERRYREGAIRGLKWMLNNYVYDLDDETSFVIDHINDNETEIKLGGNSVAIVTIAKCIEALDSEVERHALMPIMRKLGNGILYMQSKKTGNYIHVLDYPSLEVKDEFRTIYYAGEAVFALSCLYTLDNDKKWMNSIKTALKYYIANDFHKYNDHWIAYAVNEVSKHERNFDYFKFGLKNAFNDLDFIINRDTTWNTFLEMLNASVLLYMQIEKAGETKLLRKYDFDELVKAQEIRFRLQQASIMAPEMAMFFKYPYKIMHGIFIRHHSFRVRNDDVAHHIMGYCTYYRTKKL